MWQFHVIWVGKTKPRSPDRLWCEDYAALLRPRVKLHETRIAPAQGKSSATRRQKEAEQIITTLPSQGAVVLLDERGNALKTEELHAAIERWTMNTCPVVTWIVGGALGVAPLLHDRVDYVLSLSRMTLPHALARVMLYEQLYRVMCIKHRHPYHQGEASA